MSRSHTRKRKAAKRRNRVAYLKHVAAGGRRKGQARRKSAASRKDEIERTVKVLNEKGTNT